MIATVGPSRNTARASSSASIMLAFESSLTPFSTPDTAELTKTAVVTTMIATCQVAPISRPNTAFRPLLICSAPMPSDEATPNAVATTARTLNSPETARTGRQGSESVTVLMRGVPARRYWKKAIARATTL